MSHVAMVPSLLLLLHIEENKMKELNEENGQSLVTGKRLNSGKMRKKRLYFTFFLVFFLFNSRQGWAVESKSLVK